MSKVNSREESGVGGRSVTSPGNVTAIATQKRNKRHPVIGAHNGLTVNGNGQFHDRWGHPVEPRRGLIRFKYDEYSGPIWPAHGNMLGQYLADVKDTDNTARITTYDRVAAELVAYQFLGRPPASWEFVTVAHIDGDADNRHPDNLFYAVNELAVAAAGHTNIKALMRGPVTGARLVRVSDPYGVKTRNVHTEDRAKLRKAHNKARDEELRDLERRRVTGLREGADLCRNPQHITDTTRMLEAS